MQMYYFPLESMGAGKSKRKEYSLLRHLFLALLETIQHMMRKNHLQKKCSIFKDKKKFRNSGRDGHGTRERTVRIIVQSSFKQLVNNPSPVLASLMTSGQPAQQEDIVLTSRNSIHVTKKNGTHLGWNI